MVLFDLIARHALPIRVFTLDTGRLPEETLALIDRTRERYRLPIDIYVPDTAALEAFVAPMASTRSIAASTCAGLLRRSQDGAAEARACRQRRVDHRPRREQSASRQDVAPEEFDALHGLPSSIRWPTDLGGRLAVPARPRRPVQRAARSRLSEHRLRALHACGAPG